MDPLLGGTTTNGGTTRKRPMDPLPERDSNICTKRHHNERANGPSFMRNNEGTTREEANGSSLRRDNAAYMGGHHRRSLSRRSSEEDETVAIYQIV